MATMFKYYCVFRPALFIRCPATNPASNKALEARVAEVKEKSQGQGSQGNPILVGLLQFESHLL